MNILSALAAGPRAFRGSGVNEQRQPFTGTLALNVLEGGRALLLAYTATLADGTVVHTESTLLAVGPERRLCLWPVMSEIPVVLPHAETGAAPGDGVSAGAVFASGPRDETSRFREEITIGLHADGSLVYAHAWGLPGGAFEDRSSCRMVPLPD